MRLLEPFVIEKLGPLLLAVLGQLDVMGLAAFPLVHPFNSRTERFSKFELGERFL